MNGGSLMELLACGSHDPEIYKEKLYTMEKYLQMEEEEFKKTQQKIITFVSENCFNCPKEAQQLLKKLCDTDADFGNHAFHFLYFVTAKENTELFDKFVEMGKIDFKGTDNLVLYAYGSMYMLERLLRRCNKPSRREKISMWKNYVKNIKRIHEKDESNCRELYKFYVGTWNFKLEMRNIQLSKFEETRQILSKIDTVLDFRKMTLEHFGKMLREGWITALHDYVTYCHHLWSPEDVAKLTATMENTYQYIKNKFKSSLKNVIKEKDGIAVDSGECDAQYENVLDGMHAYDLCSLLVDYLDLNIDYEDYIPYETFADQLHNFNDNFDSIMKIEFEFYLDTLGYLKCILDPPKSKNGQNESETNDKNEQSQKEELEPNQNVEVVMKAIAHDDGKVGESGYETLE